MLPQLPCSLLLNPTVPPAPQQAQQPHIRWRALPVEALKRCCQDASEHVLPRQLCHLSPHRGLPARQEPPPEPLYHQRRSLSSLLLQGGLQRRHARHAFILPLAQVAVGPAAEVAVGATEFGSRYRWWWWWGG